MTRAQKLRSVLQKVQSMLHNQYNISEKQLCDKVERVVSEALEEDFRSYGPKNTRAIDSEIL